MRPGRAADHSPPSSAAVMEEYSYTSTHTLGHTRPVTGSLYLYIYTYIHISHCVETAYELTLLPNNTGSEIFLHRSGAVRSVDWIFITGVPAWRWLGEYVTLDRTYYSLLFKHEVTAAPFTATLSSSRHSSKRPLLEI